MLPCKAVLSRCRITQERLENETGRAREDIYGIHRESGALKGDAYKLGMVKAGLFITKPLVKNWQRAGLSP